MTDNQAKKSEDYQNKNLNTGMIGRKGATTLSVGYHERYTYARCRFARGSTIFLKKKLKYEKKNTTD